MSELKVFAVAGKPVLHSLSPLIFNSWFQAAGLDDVYTRLAVESAEDAAATALAMKLAGLNVTSPFKERIMGSLDGADARALKIGAANCVIRRGARLQGRNTDFIGVVRALERRGVDPRGRRAAILGAGGAARAAAYGLMLAGAARVTFLNRTEANAESAAIRIGCDHAPLEQADRVIARSDILVSCVPFPAGRPFGAALRSDAVVLQADYRGAPSPSGRSSGKAIFIDGRDWLLGQAIPAFRLFAGRAPSSRQVQVAEKRIASMAPRAKPVIALAGFMGSGKTAVGRILSRTMGWDFVDTDEEIEKAEGMTVSEIFARRGETYFRRQERALIQRLVASGPPKVISLGGGAVLREGSRRLLSRRCHVVWLWVSLETALGRIDRLSRPVLHAPGGERAVRRAFRVRFEACARASELVLNTEIASPEESARRIRYEMDPSLED